ncbi:type IX secretion component PorD family protein [Cesiribacter andamanensis]|uniref:Uncharacterized protein n=1 Tax=Cesiribacter andamanensis AMV16 TaxID=1279009 RepID=M7N7N7_9BACT|nr:DUF4835 family protein [Cesiribacter andamanensis]EMR03241.1 hypothetical protein ADICEAN_01634 [Cesiribacter andamanensis AMV16]
MNTRLQPLREFMYSYHRLALDVFTDNADGSRKLISEGLAGLKPVRDYNPSAILLIAFFDSKATELTNMFKQGAPQVKQQAYATLTALDPSNTDKYSQILR